MAERSLQEWLDYIQTVHFRSIDMALDRVETVLERITPSPAFRVIAVAGTNGKGSCAAMLGAVLNASGYRTGVYTSPHLVRFNERIHIDGEEVDDEAICEALAVIESLRGDIPLTYFEFATLAAVHIYQDRAIDFAVMEVGMGGRLDAVNALPIEAALITNVELDHMQWLGRDRESIGREKAPIIRAGRPAVFNHPDVPRSVLRYAEETGTSLLIRGRDFRGETTAEGWVWHGPDGESWSLPLPTVSGAVQVDNAAGVLALLSGLGEAAPDPETAARGLTAAAVSARCEIVARAPMIMIDVGHNLSAVATLTAQLAANTVAGRTTAVFGMLRDKDPAAVVRALDGLVDTWRLAGIRDGRGQSAAELAGSINGLVRGPVYFHDNAVDAFEAAVENASDVDRIVVFGSFHIAGDILNHLKSKS